MSDLTRRSSDTALLHPAMRVAAHELLTTTEAHGVKFTIWEAYRTPERQDYLYRTKTKTSSGKLIRRTRAKAWTSFHQYGIACDFVFDMPGWGRWANKTAEHKEGWKLLHSVGESLGLTALYNRKGRLMEKPHMHMQGFSIKQLRAGEWPPGGDYQFAENIRNSIERHKSWRKPKQGPPYPGDCCRPASLDGLED